MEKKMTITLPELSTFGRFFYMFKNGDITLAKEKNGKAFRSPDFGATKFVKYVATNDEVVIIRENPTYANKFDLEWDDAIAFEEFCLLLESSFRA